MSSNKFYLSENEITYWDIDLENIDPSHFINFYHLLSDKNKTRASLFAKDKDRNLFITAHFALDIILESLFEIKPIFLTDEHCKPFIQNYPIHFNLSHTDKRVILGFSKQALGVDIEKITPLQDLDLLIEHSMHPDEIRLLMTLDPSQKTHLFYSMWTKKEAVVKAIGIGMRKELNSFSLNSLTKDASWKIFELALDNRYSAAIATQNTASSIVGYQLRLPTTALDVRRLSRSIR